MTSTRNKKQDNDIRQLVEGYLSEHQDFQRLPKNNQSAIKAKLYADISRALCHGVYSEIQGVKNQIEFYSCDSNVDYSHLQHVDQLETANA